jgi:LL-diaminopimelate aminotransferase
MPGGTYFLYTAAPKGAGDRSFANAEEASQYLIHDQSVCCVPWDDAGAYLRFSVTYTAKDEAEEDALMAETVRRLTGLNLRF